MSPAAPRRRKGCSPHVDVAAVPLDLAPVPVRFAELQAWAEGRVDEQAHDDGVPRLSLAWARVPDAVAGGYRWVPEVVERFAPLVAWLEGLPFRSLAGVDLVTQHADVADHIDVFGANNSVTTFQRNAPLEPVSYRVVLAEPGDVEARTASFYVSRDHGGVRSYVELPPGVDAMAVSSSICYHGARFVGPGRKMTVAIHGELDPAAHLALLARSVERNADQVVRFPGAGPVRGPGAVLPYAGPAHR